jgi:hypothetical protein
VLRIVLSLLPSGYQMKTLSKPLPSNANVAYLSRMHSSRLNVLYPSFYSPPLILTSHAVSTASDFHNLLMANNSRYLGFIYGIALILNNVLQLPAHTVALAVVFFSSTTFHTPNYLSSSVLRVALSLSLLESPRARLAVVKTKPVLSSRV